MPAMAAEQVFVVTDAREENGFARCVAEDTGMEAHCELYVTPQPAELVRLQQGDRVAGTLRDASLTAVRFVERTRPPASLVAELGLLARELARHGVVLPEPLEPLAAREWRRYRKQANVPGPVWDLVRSQLTLLFDPGLDAHPFDDRSLVPRMCAAARRHGVDLDITEHLDENEDIVGFACGPDEELIPLGDDGDWEQPAGCYAPLVTRVNAALAGHGAQARWIAVDGNWILAEPALVDLLIARGFIDQPPTGSRSRRR